MSDIRDLYKLVRILEEGAEALDETIQLHDSFDIELNESFVIETGVIGFTEDGIIVEADEKTLEFLEINDVLVESEELTENPALTTLGRAVGFGSQLGDRADDKIGLEEVDELDEIKRLSAVNEGSSEGVYNSVVRRIMHQHTDVLAKFGPLKVMQAVEDLAQDLDDLDEIGSSDVSIWTKEVIRNLESGHYDHLDESKPGLWANIHAKRERIKAGSGEHMRKPGSRGAPSAQDFKDAAKEGYDGSTKQYDRSVDIGQQMANDGITYSPERENEIIGKMAEYMKRSGFSSREIRYLMNYDEDYIADQLGYLPREQGVAEDDAGDVEKRMIAKIEKEKQRLAKLKQTDPEAYKREMEKRKTSSRIPPVSTFEGQGVAEAEYQGRKVPLGKPMQGDVKKSKVYVRKPNGKVVKVNFGDKNMKIKKSNPDRRKSFRARHNCDNPGPRWKARYWSCRAW